MDDWIRVKDRLPRGSTKVLTWDGSNFEVAYYWRDAHLWYSSGEQGFVYGITHWMPIHKPKPQPRPSGRKDE